MRARPLCSASRNYCYYFNRTGMGGGGCKWALVASAKTENVSAARLIKQAQFASGFQLLMQPLLVHDGVKSGGWLGVCGAQNERRRVGMRTFGALCRALITSLFFVGRPRYGAQQFPQRPTCYYIRAEQWG